MTNQEAIRILAREKQMTCADCMHPQIVGYCEDYCKLPEAYDMAIQALKSGSNVKEE